MQAVTATDDAPRRAESPEQLVTHEPSRVRAPRAAAMCAAALDARPVAQLVLDSRDALVVATPAARRMFGLAASDWGCPVRDLELPPLLLDYFGRRARARRPVVAARTTWMTEGEPRFLEISITPLARGAAVSGTSVTVRDTTRRRQLKAELDATREQIEKACHELHAVTDELVIGFETLRTMSRALQLACDEVRGATDQLHRIRKQVEDARAQRRRLNAEFRRRRDELEAREAWIAGALGALSDAGVAGLSAAPRARA